MSPCQLQRRLGCRRGFSIEALSVYEVIETAGGIAMQHPHSRFFALCFTADGLRRRLRALLFGAVATIGLSLSLNGVSRGDTPLPPARDLQSSVARTAARQQPLVVMFSLPGCTYCERLRKSTYQWLAKDGYGVVQVEMESKYRLLDFHGKATNGQALAHHYKVSLAPTVLFFGPGGKEVADRLVGAGEPDFYQAFVDRALKQGEQRLGVNAAGTTKPGAPP